MHSMWPDRTLAFFAAALLLAPPVWCQEVVRDLETAGLAIRPAPADPAISQVLRRISAEEIRHDIETLAGFVTRATLSSMEAELPRGEGIKAAGDWIEAQFRRYSSECNGCLEVKRDTFTEVPQDRIPRPTLISNVYAILRGSDPTQAARMLLVTGHYDSRNSDPLDGRGAAPGANDDASGVAVSLECARVLSKLRPPASIVFVAVAGEEQGLNGSRHLAKLARREGWHLEGVLNNDIVGGNTMPGDTLQDKSVVRVFSEDIPAAATAEQVKLIQSIGYASDSSSRELARAIAEVAETYGGIDSAVSSERVRPFRPVLEFRRDRFLRGGDHTSFNQEGFAAVRLTEWREDFRHQHQNVRVEGGTEYGDLPKFVDFQYVARVAILNAATLATLAYAPAPPVNVRILTKALDNDTTLEWESGGGANAATSYEVVWRETSAPRWQRAAFVPSGRTVTVPVAKDNVIFGVRSLDAAGHRSAAVYPWPER